MKKIFTLLFSLGVFATSFAQTGHKKDDKKNNQYVTQNQILIIKNLIIIAITSILFLQKKEICKSLRSTAILMQR